MGGGGCTENKTKLIWGSMVKKKENGKKNKITILSNESVEMICKNPRKKRSLTTIILTIIVCRVVIMYT